MERASSATRVIRKNLQTTPPRGENGKFHGLAFGRPMFDAALPVTISEVSTQEVWSYLHVAQPLTIWTNVSRHMTCIRSGARFGRCTDAGSSKRQFARSIFRFRAFSFQLQFTDPFASAQYFVS